MARAKQPPKDLKAEPTVIVDEQTTGEVLEGEIQDGEVRDEPTTDEDGLHHGFVEFHGRTIEVRAPGIEQVVIIRRLQKVFSDAALLKEIDAEEAVKLMDRALLAITSVTVHDKDVEFVENLWLSRTIKLEQTLPLLTTAMATLEKVNADKMNRAERRAAAKKSTAKSGRASLVTN